MISRSSQKGHLRVSFFYGNQAMYLEYIMFEAIAILATTTAPITGAATFALIVIMAMTTVTILWTDSVTEIPEIVETSLEYSDEWGQIIDRLKTERREKRSLIMIGRKKTRDEHVELIAHRVATGSPLVFDARQIALHRRVMKLQYVSNRDIAELTTMAIDF